MVFHTFQRGDQLVCPPGESLENMLILQDTINDERSRRSSAAEGPGPESEAGPAPTPTASQNNHEPQGQLAGCSQPSIVPNPSSSSSVRRISVVCDVSIVSKKVKLGEYLPEVLLHDREGGRGCKMQYLPREFFNSIESQEVILCVLHQQWFHYHFPQKGNWFLQVHKSI